MFDWVSLFQRVSLSLIFSYSPTSRFVQKVSKEGGSLPGKVGVLPWGEEGSQGIGVGLFQSVSGAGCIVRRLR